MSRKGVFEHEDVKTTFLEAIEMGFSNEKACDYASISEPTFYAWINRANAEIESGKKSSVYIKFLKDYKKAKSTFVMKHVKRITKASDDGTWQASAWLLERRCPDEFGLRNDVNITNEKISVVNDIPEVEEGE